jgi:hypothetical protein
LLDSSRPLPSGLVGPDGQPSLKRFSVYRNNVVVSLIEALQAGYPAVSRIVGEEFFRVMARAFVLAHPPASPIMLAYGAGFADFISEFEPARPFPYLGDVARIERAWLEAYHAAEAKPLARDDLAAIPRERIGQIRFMLHPSVRIVRSRYPALAIWRMNVADGVPAPVDLDAGGEDTLVWRPQAEVEVRSMPRGGAEFVGALLDGQLLSLAGEIAMQTMGFDLAANLAALFDANIFTGYEIVQTGESQRGTA